MTRPETAQLLTLIACYDQRTLGEADVLAWHMALANVDFETARGIVVTHYRKTGERIRPHNVVQASVPPREEWMHRP